MTKRIISIILAVILSASVCVVAFGEDSYNYLNDEKLRATAEVLENADKGIYTWGQYSPAYFYPLDKTVHPLSDIPKVVDEETGEETDEDLYEDSTSCEAENEIIRIAAFYCFKCPACGTVHGDYSLYSLYTKTAGICTAVTGKDAEGNDIVCNTPLPDPSTITIYRFIVLDESTMGGTSHSTTMRYYDFTSAAKDVYGSTASLYGDGTDLPENSITFTKYGSSLPTKTNQEYDISDFSTTSVKADTGNRLKAWLLVFLTKLQYKLGPKLENYADSNWAAFKNNVRVTMAGIWQNILIALVNG